MPRPVGSTPNRPGSDPFPLAARLTGAQVAFGGFDHTCTIERDAETTTDTWGGPAAADWEPVYEGVPCLGIIKDGQEQIGQNARTASFEDRRVLFPLGTDITVNDRLTSLTDENGADVFDGPMLVTAPPYRRASFLEVEVQQIT